MPFVFLSASIVLKFFVCLFVFVCINCCWGVFCFCLFVHLLLVGVCFVGCVWLLLFFVGGGGGREVQ